MTPSLHQSSSMPYSTPSATIARASAWRRVHDPQVGIRPSEPEADVVPGPCMDWPHHRREGEESGGRFTMVAGRVLHGD